MNQEVTKKLDDLDRAIADMDMRKPAIEPRTLPPATPPVSTSSIDKLFEDYSRAGPLLLQRIIAERADLTGVFEREMAAHIEDSRAAADRLRSRYEQRINELDQIARRIGE